MGRALLAVAVGLLAFAGGLVGMYHAMPSLDPERVAETRAYLDSLALVDTLEQLDSTRLALLKPPPVELPDSLWQHIATRDTMIVSLHDSIAALHQRIQRSNDDVTSLRQAVDAINARWDAMEARRAEAAQVSGTLTKLEDNELRDVLTQLDFAMLEQLYIASSKRNRTRLLQNIDPERAASIVRSLMDAPDDDAVPTAAPPSGA